MKRLLSAAALLSLTACGSRGEENPQPQARQADSAEAEQNAEDLGTSALPTTAAPNAQVPAPAGDDNIVSEEPFTATSAQGAANVVQTYYALLEAGKFGDAWRLWSDGGRASGMSQKAFADSFDKYAEYHAEVFAPGRIEGAAGSLYVTVPVRVYGRLKTGEPFNMDGPITLRRVNDVPGSTAEQRRWHISQSGVRPRPTQASYRFIGKWAQDERACGSESWRFTADGLRSAKGTSCRFNDVRTAAGGYDVAARCSPGGADRIEIRFAESARAMLVESRVVGDVGLVPCQG